MSDPQQIERELREYLEKEPNLRRDERLSFLKIIFEKHLEINKLEHIINRGDLFEVESASKNHFSKMKTPVRITGRDVDMSDTTRISVIEAFISYLNKMNLLRKRVRLDYTE